MDVNEDGDVDKEKKREHGSSSNDGVVNSNGFALGLERRE